MPEGGAPNAENRAYFRGILFALAALARRLEARPGLTGDEALAEIRRYQAVVQENLQALEKQSDP